MTSHRSHEILQTNSLPSSVCVSSLSSALPAMHNKFCFVFYRRPFLIFQFVYYLLPPPSLSPWLLPSQSSFRSSYFHLSLYINFITSTTTSQPQYIVRRQPPCRPTDARRLIMRCGPHTFPAELHIHCPLCFLLVSNSPITPYYCFIIPTTLHSIPFILPSLTSATLSRPTFLFLLPSALFHSYSPYY